MNRHSAGGGKINLLNKGPKRPKQPILHRHRNSLRDTKKNKKHTLTAALDDDFQSRIHQRPDVARGETHAILTGMRLLQDADGQSGIWYGRTDFHALDEQSGRAALLLLLLRGSVESREQSHHHAGAAAGLGGSTSSSAAAMVIVVATTRRIMLRDRRKRRRRRRRQVEPRDRIDDGGEEYDDDDDDRRDDSHYF